jgi:ribosomal protein L21E
MLRWVGCNARLLCMQSNPELYDSRYLQALDSCQRLTMIAVPAERRCTSSTTELKSSFISGKPCNWKHLCTHILYHDHITMVQTFVLPLRSALKHRAQVQSHVINRGAYVWVLAQTVQAGGGHPTDGKALQPGRRNHHQRPVRRLIQNFDGGAEVTKVDSAEGGGHLRYQGRFGDGGVRVGARGIASCCSAVIHSLSRVAGCSGDHKHIFREWLEYFILVTRHKRAYVTLRTKYFQVFRSFNEESITPATRQWDPM